MLHFLEAGLLPVRVAADEEALLPLHERRAPGCAAFAAAQRDVAFAAAGVGIRHAVADVQSHHCAPGEGDEGEGGVFHIVSGAKMYAAAHDLDDLVLEQPAEKIDPVDAQVVHGPAAAAGLAQHPAGSALSVPMRPSGGTQTLAAEYLPERAGTHQILEGDADGVIAPDVRRGEDDSAPARSIYHEADTRGVGRHRLFRQDVDAAFGTRDGRLGAVGMRQEQDRKI